MASRPVQSSAPAQSEPTEQPLPATIGGRYRAIREIGRGGMASVIEAYDSGRDVRIALKRLLPTWAENPAARDLFELEYHTLYQLKHPAIVRAFEFGRSDEGSYYTMELLDGGDLRAHCPYPWERVCEILAQVCSALSLLHSRRLIHRDVKPQNVRCTAQGRAKLMDFGAMAAAGPCSKAVGTPAFCAPEMLGGQTIDARTDLFAVGATAYWSLSGEHAYPANSFAKLHRAWANPPVPIDRLVPDIPPQLAELVMSMLSLEPLARPGSAVEVMQRLAAIAGIDAALEVAASQHLATPTMVGREQALQAARQQLARAAKGRGSVLLLTSAPGGGRSRCLDACMLEATLRGTCMLRAGRAEDPSPWGWTRSLLMHMREVLPERWLAACPDVARLQHAFPSALPLGMDLLSAPPPRVSPAQRAAVLELVAETLLRLCATQPLGVAVDDLERLDEPSAALVAMLAMRARQHGLWLAVTTDPAAPASSEAAREVLMRSAQRVELAPLTLTETRHVLGSLFGEVPHLDLLADRLQQASHGKPRSLLQLAQHLIDEGVISHRGGVFILPEDLAVADLPVDALAADRLRAAKLSSSARALAELVALYPTHSISNIMLERLTPELTPLQRMQLLDELQAAAVLTVDGPYCTLADRDTRSALLDGIDRESERRHCLLLAERLRSEADQFEVSVAYLVRAGQRDEALARLLSHLDDAGSTAEVGQALADRLAALPDGWLDTCDELLAHCETQGHPRRAAHRIRAYLFSTALLLEIPVNHHSFAVLNQLAHDCGLDLYAELDGLASGERVQRALGLAQARFDGAGEQERVLPPGEAIPLLARTTSQAVAQIYQSGDITLMERLPDISPLRSLSPALDLMCQNVHYTACNVSGRDDECLAGYYRMIERLEQPDRCGFDLHGQRYIRLSLLYGACRMEVLRERDKCLEIADELDQDPMFISGAWTVRMCHAVLTGDHRRAQQCREQLEIRRIRDQPKLLFATTALWLCAQCYARCDDLLRVQQLASAMEPIAERFPAWQERLHFARASYHRICGNYDLALAEIQRAAERVEVCRNSAWATVAPEHARILRLCGQADASRAQAQHDLELATATGLQYAKQPIRLALALALLELGEHTSAAEQADAVIQAYHEAETRGVSLGEAYEARARIALSAGDRETFAACLERCGHYYRPGHNTTLTVRYARLAQAARAGAHGAVVASGVLAEVGSLHYWTSLLLNCDGAASRVQRALEALVELTATAGGWLYTLEAGEPRLVACTAAQKPGPLVADFVRRFIRVELESEGGNTMTALADNDDDETEALPESLQDQEGGLYLPHLISHVDDGALIVTGVALLRTAGPQSSQDLPPHILHRISEALHDPSCTGA